jgi:glutamine cyclotransferase
MNIMKSILSSLALLFLLTSHSFAQGPEMGDPPAQTHKRTALTLSCDTISSFPLRDTWPIGIAWDGANLWSGGIEDRMIYQYTTSGTVLHAIPSPDSVYGVSGLTFDGQALWAFTEQTNQLYQLDTSDGSILSQFSLPLDGNGLGIAFAGGYIYASQYHYRYIIKVDPMTGQTVATLNLPSQVFAIAWINNELYGMGAGASYLYKIDHNAGSILDSIAWCVPYGVDIAWDGSHLWNVSSKQSLGGRQRAYQIASDSILAHIVALQSQTPSWSIGPNPAQNVLHVQASTAMRGSPYGIKDFTGREILRGILGSTQMSITLPNLPSGIYYLNWEGQGTRSFVVLQH